MTHNPQKPWGLWDKRVRIFGFMHKGFCSPQRVIDYINNRCIPLTPGRWEPRRFDDPSCVLDRFGPPRIAIDADIRVVAVNGNEATIELSPRRTADGVT